MSQTNTAAATSSSSLQSRLGTLVVIPWAGQYGEDGGDVGVDRRRGHGMHVIVARREPGAPLGSCLVGFRTQLS